MTNTKSFTVVMKISGISANDKETFLELIQTELEALQNVKIVTIEERQGQNYFATLIVTSVDDLTARLKITEQVDLVLQELTTDSNYKIKVESLRST